MIAHIVLFEPKATASADDRRAFLTELRRAIAAITEVGRARVGRVFDFGVMTEIEGGRLTYSYAAIVEFETKEQLAAYLTHPGHDQLRTLFWGMCERTVIADADLIDASSTNLDGLAD